METPEIVNATEWQEARQRLLVQEKELTKDTMAAGRKVRASKEEPQYLVKSDKSGGEAVHKPGTLKKDGQ